MSAKTSVKKRANISSYVNKDVRSDRQHPYLLPRLPHTVRVQRGTGYETRSSVWRWSVAVVSSVAVWYSHLSVSSNQSALWSCLRHLTSQVGEGCTMSFVRFVLLIRWKTCVWNSFGVFSPMGVRRILQECEVCSSIKEEVMQWFSSFCGKMLFAVLSKGFFI